MALAEIHTELQILEHDRLVYLLPCPVFFAFDDIVQDIEGWLLLANLKKLWMNTKHRIFVFAWAQAHVYMQNRMTKFQEQLDSLVSGGKTFEGKRHKICLLTNFLKLHHYGKLIGCSFLSHLHVSSLLFISNLSCIRSLINLARPLPARSIDS